MSTRLTARVLGLALCLLLLCTLAAASSRTRHRLTRTASWDSLQSDLQGEVDSGLDEETLARLESAEVNAKGAACKLQQPRSCNTERTVTVQMHISIDRGTVNSRPHTGVLTMELFNATAPRTVRNFMTICDGKRRGFTYKNNRFHRIISGFMAQGGDITRGDGRGGKSIYGTTFRDETFRCHHVCRGGLSMANSGPDTNGSQFFVTFGPTNWLDGKHVVFGQTVDGWDTLAAMEAAGSQGGQPQDTVTITHCQVV